MKMFVSLCLTSKKPSERDFFVPAGTDFKTSLFSKNIKHCYPTHHESNQPNERFWHDHTFINIKCIIIPGWETIKECQHQSIYAEGIEEQDQKIKHLQQQLTEFNSLTPKSVPGGTKNSRSEGFLLVKHKHTNIPTMMEPFAPPAAWDLWIHPIVRADPLPNGSGGGVVEGI